MTNPVELTKELVRIKSSFDALPYENDVAIFIEKFLKEQGFTTHRQPVPTHETKQDNSPHRFNILAEKGRGEKSLLLYGHMDTVPRVEGWEKEPWQPVIEGNKLYGLGSHDMKGGLACLLSAISGFTPNGYKLKLAFLVDEENMSRGAYQLIRSDWLGDVVLALVPESGTSDNQELGPQMITLGRRGRVTVQVEVAGISAHAAQPEKGISALHRAAQIIDGLHRAVDNGKIRTIKDAKLGAGSFSIRSIESDAKSLSIPDKAVFFIDRHLTLGESVELAIQEIQGAVQLLVDNKEIIAPNLPILVKLKERVNPYLMPYVTDSNHPFVKQIEYIIKDTLDVDEVEHNWGLSVADENYFGADVASGGRNLPVVVIGTTGNNNHAADEWVAVDSLYQLTNVYQNILHDFNTWVVRD